MHGGRAHPAVRFGMTRRVDSAIAEEHVQTGQLQQTLDARLGADNHDPVSTRQRPLRNFRQHTDRPRVELDNACEIEDHLSTVHQLSKDNLLQAIHPMIEDGTPRAVHDGTLAMSMNVNIEDITHSGTHQAWTL